MSENSDNHLIVGIDYSMTSPAISVDSKRFYALGDKKLIGSYENDTIFISRKPKDFDSQQERFNRLASWAISIILQEQHNTSKNALVYLEGYSYGSKGKIFEIGENTGQLKHSLWVMGVPFEVVAPTSIKSFATQNGRAKKEEMHDAWIERGMPDLRNVFALKKKGLYSPISDIVDSYWLSEYGKEDYEQKRGTHF